MKENYTSLFLVLFIFLSGVSLVYWMNQGDSVTSKHVFEAQDTQEVLNTNDNPTQSPVKTVSPQSVQLKNEMPKPLAKNPEPTIPQTKKTFDRYPPNLGDDQVYFEITKEGYAIASGDILLGKVSEQQKHLTGAVNEPEKTVLWPNATIPFRINEEVVNEAAIHQAIDYFNTHTVIRFVEADERDTDVLVFVPTENHCASHLGRVGGWQPILVSAQCGKTEVMHELMHALGFVHEHSRSDRDRFLEIKWQNIQPNYISQFNKMPDQWVHAYSGAVFDFDGESIMLYADNAFAKAASLKTMVAKGRIEMAPSRGELSRRDLERLYYLYGH